MSRSTISTCHVEYADWMEERAMRYDQDEREWLAGVSYEAEDTRELDDFVPDVATPVEKEI